MKTIVENLKKKKKGEIDISNMFPLPSVKAVNQFMEIRPCIHVVKVETLILQNVKQAVFRLFTSSDIDFKYYWLTPIGVQIKKITKIILDSNTNKT